MLNLYGRLYRVTMKVSHRFNWHHTRTIYPDGDTMLICDWCGLRYIARRASQRDAISIARSEES